MMSNSPRGLEIQLVRFAGIGTLGAATNLLVYSVSLYMGIHYIAAAFAGWFLGLLVVFFLNRRFTFRGSSSMARDFIRTVGVYVGQQLLVVAGLALGVEVLRLHPMLSYFIVVPLAVVWSFLGMKLYAMRSRN